MHAEIAGDGSTTQEVAIGGHLFEGYIKQGANDDNSGCALTLEIGRTYLELIKAGKLPKPKRTINFQWVQEISGTNAWFNAHPEKQQRIIGDLNFDMTQLNERFGLTHLRQMDAADLQASEDREADFDRYVDDSFLPLMLRDAANANVHVCFVRVQRRPEGGQPPAQTPAMRRYIAKLRIYVEAHGARFHDDTGDPQLTLDMSKNLLKNE